MPSIHECLMDAIQRRIDMDKRHLANVQKAQLIHLSFTADEMGMLQGGMDSEHEYWEQRVCDAENAIDEDTDQGLVNAYHTESLVYNQENLDLAHRVRAKIDEVLDDPA